jgi:hypothetical protein
MNKFPKEIDIKNKTLQVDEYHLNFKSYNDERIIKIFRNEVYDYLISRKEENDYFDIEGFCKKYNYDRKDFISILEKVLIELQKMGWKTELSYGDSAVFIYSTEEKPRSCWNDEII